MSGFICFFFFKQKTAYEMRISDWSSDVCSSDLEVGGAVAADAPIDWNEVEIANRRHDARIGLLLGRDQQRPVGWISDVLEQVDRWKSTADDPDSTLPINSRDWDVRRFAHQPPRSASR